MVRYSVAAVLFTAMILVAGCENQSVTTMTYTRDQALPPLATVITPGRYGLFAGDSSNPVWSEELNAEDEYGFVKRADGAIYAVAKGKDIALPDAQAKVYYWKTVPKHHVADE